MRPPVILNPLHPLQPAEFFFQDLPEEKQDRDERLVLREGAHVAVPGQVRQEVAHLLLTQGRGMAPVVADELAHPLEIRLLGAETLVLDTDGIADPIEEGV